MFFDIIETVEYLYADLDKRELELKQTMEKMLSHFELNLKTVTLQYERIRELEEANAPKPIEEWHEDDGDCLWWKFPVEEPPYCGSPLELDFPNYVTHYTKFSCPKEVEAE
jgi:hypothetical protein